MIRNKPPIIPFGRMPKLADDPNAGGHLCVMDFFRNFTEPVLRDGDRAPETLREYRRHVRRWHEWLANDRIDNPVVPISEVSRADLLDWRKWLMSKRGIQASPRTANKHLGSLQAILATAGERGAHLCPPRIKPLDVQKAAKKLYLTYDQVGAIYAACDAAEWPTVDHYGAPLPFSPGTYWRAFVVLQFNYGPRTQELWSYEKEYEGLTWRQVSWEAETPAQEGTAENRHGWFHYVPQKQIRLKPDPLVLPLNEAAAAAIRSIMPPGGCDPRERLFPAPHGDKKFYEAWDTIVKASRVKLKVDLKTGERPPVHIKLFRKTCETWHDNHAAGDGRAGIGEIITGHAERSVSGKHYANRERRLVEAINAFPQPEEFGGIKPHAKRRA